MYSFVVKGHPERNSVGNSVGLLFDLDRVDLSGTLKVKNEHCTRDDGFEGFDLPARLRM